MKIAGYNKVALSKSVLIGIRTISLSEQISLLQVLVSLNL